MVWHFLFKCSVLCVLTLVCGCNIRARVEYSSDQRERIEVVKGVSRIFIHYYENNRILLDYVHYLPFDQMARRYKSCMTIRLRGDDELPNYLYRVCVNSQRVVMEVVVGRDGSMASHFNCTERNRRLCLLMQYRFNDFYERLGIERIVNDAIYGSVLERTEDEEDSCEE